MTTKIKQEVLNKHTYRQHRYTRAKTLWKHTRNSNSMKITNRKILVLFLSLGL